MTSAEAELPPPTPAAPLTTGAAQPRDPLTVTLDVEPRKPRLAWQGMERKELAGAVPTQVVEIVRPGRAVERKGELDLGAWAAAREELPRPESRLIWTNDNLVALQTLFEERDPKTKDWRYRGKVDLVYIDPPFMVNDDFRADNAIDIELDEKAHVQARKEPSLVEIVAYKDTWRQGLDTFASMLRARLILLKQLLTPTGSIYVHLDWHAVHYVKVLMDEVFGYENFSNEIIWKRRSGYMGSFNKLGSVTDTLLVYAAGPSPFFRELTTPHDPEYIKRFKYRDAQGRLYRLDNLTRSMGPRPNLRYVYKGFSPPPNGWAVSLETMQQMDKEGRIDFPDDKSKRLQRRSFLDEKDGTPLQNLWDDIAPVNPMAVEDLGYPTQKPLALLERVISISSPPGGLVLDCFVGSGTTAEAAEKLGRRWIGIDNGKYAVHLSRKRLIQLHGQPRPAQKPSAEYVECETCKNVERKVRSQKSPGPFNVRSFSVENMGVYQRASQWQGFQQQRSVYRDEMIRVFGGEPIEHSPLLHGRKGGSWVHVGPLDAPVSSVQVWSIAREAQRTSTKAITVLSADFDTLSGSEKDEIKKKTGVAVTVRVIPASAIDEVKRRLDLLRSNPDMAVESTAIPAFYAPLSIVLDEKVSGRNVTLTLKRCEVDIESFIASQRPMLKAVTDRMTDNAKKKALDELKRWEKREKELKDWLDRARSWEAFVDFWAVDWDYGRHLGEDEKPIFVTEWQSFRSRGADGSAELTFTAKFSYPEAGVYRIAARVTDVFGNDGIATVEVEVLK